MTILIDGAVGTELERRGARVDAPLWSARALLDDPALVETIHLDYLRAGAQLLTTNTFRTHARNLAGGGDELSARAGELTALACALARAARERYAAESRDAAGVRVAGSISPLEDCYEPDRSPVRARALPEHRAMAEQLVRAGCDLLLIETMGRVDEARAAVDACEGLGRPVWLSLVCRADGRLIGGETLGAMVDALDEGSAQALLVNCTDLEHTPVVVGALLEATERAPALTLGLYPHTGHNDPVLGWRGRAVNSEQFADGLCRVFADHPRLEVIGSCCGSDPSWTRALAERVHANAEARARGFEQLARLVPRA